MKASTTGWCAVVAALACWMCVAALAGCARTANKDSAGGRATTAQTGCCGESGDGVTVSAVPGCSAGGFRLEPSQDLATEQTPTAAIARFETTRGLFGPNDYPDHHGYPRQGWQEVSRTKDRATFMSGRSTLHLTRLPAGGWKVRSGETCSGR